MIYDYFSKVQRKLETIKWIIIEQSVNFDFVFFVNEAFSTKTANTLKTPK